MDKCTSISLSGALENYLIERQIEVPKYYTSYLVAAKWAWKELFRNTLYAVQSTWLSVMKGEPYDFIEVPYGASRIFSVANIDKCNLIQPLFYNDQINVIPKPASSGCGCGECRCDGLCGEMNDLTVTTKEVFRVNGVPYYERSWIKICKNGDVLEYREVPTKKYNDFVGSSGDFNNDFNDDFDIGAEPFSNYEIVTQTLQNKICALKVRPCGCVENTPENIKMINECCGCYLSPYSRMRKMCCNQFQENINDNGFGEVKMSDCGTKIYFIPPKNCHPNARNPTHLLLNWQSNGEKIGEEVQMPDYAYDAFTAILHDRVVKRNGKFALWERQEAERHKEKEINNLIKFMNPISLEFLADTQDKEIRW